jgi:hypothetical protein
VLAVGIALALGGAIAWRLYGAYGTPPLQTQVVSYQVISDARVEITFRVTAADDHSGGELRCTLRARGSSGDEVARAEVTLTVPPGETLEARRTLTTRARAVTGELLRCA